MDGYGDRLRAARRRAGLTQAQLAARASVSVRALADLEAGRVAEPRRDTVERLATALSGHDPKPAPAATRAPEAPEAPEAWCRLFGRFRVTGPGGTVTFGSTRRASLAAYLALCHPEPVPVAELTDVVWPDGARRTPAALHSQVSRVRTALAGLGTGTTVEFAAGGYRLVPGDLAIDLDRLRDLVHRAEAAGQAPEALPLWASATDLATGPLLADLPDLAAHPAAVAARQQAVAAALRYTDLTTTLAAHPTGTVDHHPARTVGLLTRLLRDDPVHEGIALRLMGARCTRSSRVPPARRSRARARPPARARPRRPRPPASRATRSRDTG